jgi:hypothetical protein
MTHTADDMIEDVGAEPQGLSKDHCSYWSGIPQSRLNEFNRRCIGILCNAFKTGVYNLNINWNKAEFAPRYSVFVLRNADIATFDFSQMSRLVFAAHDECVRICVSPRTFRHLEIMMHQRQRAGDMSRRHPTLENAISDFRRDDMRGLPNG